MQHRTGHRQLGIAGQPQDHLGRGAGDILQRLGQNLADLGDLVARQPFQGLEGDAAQTVLLMRRQAGRQARDLGRQIAAHRVAGIGGEQQIGLGRGLGIGRDVTANLGIGILGQEIEDFRLDVVTLRHLGADLRIGMGGQGLGLLVIERPLARPAATAEQPLEEAAAHAPSPPPGSGAICQAPLPPRLT